MIPNNETEKKEVKAMKKWVCSVCGYVHEGDTPPEKCPVCKQPAEKFNLVEEEKKNPYAGTQTEKNLETAFAGESQARNKYTYFASVAKKEGYEQMAALFLKTADNEKEHAKMWFKELNGLGDTADNLLSAAEGENICTMALLRLLKQKDFRSLLLSSAWLPLLKNIMRNTTVHCFTIWKQHRFLKRVK